MDWFFNPVDIYCERLAPGLLGEPLNALTNLGFFLAAFLLLRQKPQGDLRLLTGLIALIGAGSLSFHVFATGGTAVLDVLFIAVFILFYVYAFFRRIHGLQPVEGFVGVA